VHNEANDRNRKITFTLCVAVLAIVLIALIAEPQRAQSAEVRKEAETATLSGSHVFVHSDASASGGKDVVYYSEGSASAAFSGGLTNVSLRARGTSCNGDAKLRVFVDGIAKGTIALTSPNYGLYPLTVSGVGTGSHQIKIRYINDYNVASCDRNAYLDYYTVTTPEAGVPSADTDNPFAGEKFYVNPNSNARKTADQWYANGRTAAAQQMEKIARNPDIFYFSEWTMNAAGGTPAHVDWQTDRITAAGALPVYGVYAIPHRDCGSYSGGGFTTGAQYKAWIDDIVTGMQGREAVFVIEPDALAAGCLTDAQWQERFSLIRYAVNRLESTGSHTYIDASNCFAPNDYIINHLKQAGIADATGFARNTSNFCWSSSEVEHGTTISKAVGGKHFIIDTSRNGFGPYQGANNWCNPPGRALGIQPTANTGNNLVDAYYWLKRPGESDGTCNGGPSAGTWWPDYALVLAQRSAY
jgi:endoglucanase